MSLDPPTYLASLQSNIRQRPIPWDGAVRAGSLTEDQYAKIRAVDKAKKPEQRKEIVTADLDGYRLLFVGGNGSTSVLETAGKNANLVQYILVLLADLLDGKSNFRLHAASDSVRWSRSSINTAAYIDALLLRPKQHFLLIVDALLIIHHYYSFHL